MINTDIYDIETQICKKLVSITYVEAEYLFISSWLILLQLKKMNFDAREFPLVFQIVISSPPPYF